MNNFIKVLVMDSVETDIIESSQTMEVLQGKGTMVLTNTFFVFFLWKRKYVLT